MRAEAPKEKGRGSPRITSQASPAVAPMANNQIQVRVRASGPTRSVRIRPSRLTRSVDGLRLASYPYIESSPRGWPERPLEGAPRLPQPRQENVRAVAQTVHPPRDVLSIPRLQEERQLRAAAVTTSDRPAATPLPVRMWSKVARTSSLSLVEKYHSNVRRRPSVKETFGSQPKSCLASALSATRFIGPVGMPG